MKIFDKFELFFLSLFILALPFSISISQISFFLAAIIFISLCVYNKSFIKSELDMQILIYILINFISISLIIIKNNNNVLSIEHNIIEFISLTLISIFYVIIKINNKKNAIWLLYVLLLCTLINSVFGIYQHIHEGIMRVPSFLDSCMSMGHFSTMVLLLGIGLFNYEKKLYLRIIIASVLLIIGMSVFFTYTRGAWVGLFIGVVIFSLYTKDYKILLSVIIISFLFVFIDKSINERLNSIFTLQDTSNAERLRIWKHSIKSTFDNPIFGIGINNFRNVFQKDANTSAWINAHNIYLNHSVELGIPGLLSFLFIIIIFIKINFNIYKNIINEYRSIIAGAFSTFVAFLVSGFFDYNYGDKEIFMLLWFAMGIPILLSRKD